MLDLPAECPEVLVEMVRCIDERLRRRLPPDQSGALAVELVMALADRFGGGPFSFPLGASLDRARRNAQIRREFDGRNHRALARRWRLHLATIYEIVSERRPAGFFAQSKCCPTDFVPASSERIASEP